jgi:hypothetical protein
MTHRKMWLKSSYCISDSTRHNFEYSNERAPAQLAMCQYKYNALPLFLGAKSTSIRDCVRWLVRPSVGPSPTMQLRGKLVTSRLLREEEEEEETDYVAIPLRHDSFAPRD